MSFHCFKCGAAQTLSATSRVGRTECCSKCNSDLHCCKNCTHYDSAAYNMCRESQAERVVEKDRSNFCDYFSFRESKGGTPPGPTSKASKLSKLDDLFKK